MKISTALVLLLLLLTASWLSVADDSGGETSDSTSSGDPIPAETAAERRYGEALQFYRAGRPDGHRRADWLRECEEMFQHVIDDFPGTDERLASLYCRSLCQEKQKRYRAAIEGIEEFLKEPSEAVPPIYAMQCMARCYRELHLWEEAVPLYQKICINFPDSPMVPISYYEAGLNLRDLGRLEEARTVWERLIKLFPDSREAESADKRMDTLIPVKKRLKPLTKRYAELTRKKKATSRAHYEALEHLQELLEKFSDIPAPETEKFLLKAFKSAKPEVRAMIVEPLIEVGSAKAAKLLLANLEKFEEQTAYQILKRLGAHQVEGVSVTKAIGPILEGQRLSNARTAAMGFLGRIDTVESARLLVGCVQTYVRPGFKNQYRYNNSPVIRALGDIRNPKALDFLCEKVLLNDSADATQRFVVADALARTHSRRAGVAFVEVLTDPLEDFNLMGLRGLELLRQKEHAPAILEALTKSSKGRAQDAFRRGCVGALEATHEGLSLQQALELSQVDEPSARVLAVDVLNDSYQEAPARGRLLELLSDDAWQVRQASIEALSLHPSIEIIDAIVAQLEKETGALARRFGEHLTGLTGAEIGYKFDDWKRYWNAARQQWVAEAKGDDVGTRGRDFVKQREGHTGVATFFGLRLITKNVVFVIDTSKSMVAEVDVPDEDGQIVTQRRMDLAYEELRNCLRRIGKETRFNVICFNDQLNQVFPTARKADKKNLEMALAAVKAIEPVGGTNIYDALHQGVISPAVDTVCLLSDGDPTAGQFIRAEEILREIRDLNGSRQITIHTISLGYRSKLMADIALENLGDHVAAGRALEEPK